MSAQYKSKINSMIEKIIQIISAKMFFWTLPPLGALSSIWSFFEFEKGDWRYGAVGLVGFILIGIVGYLVKYKLGKRQLEIQDREVTIGADKSNDELSLQLMRMMQEENVRREEFWTKRIDQITNNLRMECEKEKIFWADREQKVRDEKHDEANKANLIVLKFDRIVTQLKQRGIEVNNMAELIWPEKLQRLRKDDPNLSSGEFKMR